MNKLELAKNITNLIVGTGTATIVKTIIRNNVQPDNLVDKTCCTAGALVLGAMAADVSKQYTNAKIDSAIAWWKANITD